MKPKISIITVNYNEAAQLEQTLQKSIEQNYSDKEIIVIDGGSTDNSPQIIKKYSRHIAYSCSEPDQGIYDAMNKGIKKATGDWVIFMNAGDWFYDSNILHDLFSTEKHKDVDFIYGDNEIRYQGFTRIHRANRPLSILSKTNVFSHQALFSKMELMKKNPFKIKYSMVADFESFYFHYKEGKRFRYIPTIVSSISAGGISEVKANTACRERKEIVLSQEPSLSLKYYYLSLEVKNNLRQLLKKMLPTSAVRFITQLKYKIGSDRK